MGIITDLTGRITTITDKLGKITDITGLSRSSLYFPYRNDYAYRNSNSYNLIRKILTVIGDIVHKNAP